MSRFNAVYNTALNHSNYDTDYFLKSSYTKFFMTKLFADSRKCKLLLYKKLPTILLFGQRVQLTDKVVDQSAVKSWKNNDSKN